MSRSSSSIYTSKNYMVLSMVFLWYVIFAIASKVGSPVGYKDMHKIADGQV